MLRLDELGSGVAAVVWRAQVQDRTGRTSLPVAVKEPRGDGGMTREDVEREATLLALLDHHNVVAIVGVVTVPPSLPPLLLLEYCENGSLDQYMKRSRLSGLRVPMVIRLSFCADIAAGLQYASYRRVVHRDVSANVFISLTLTVTSGIMQRAAVTELPESHNANRIGTALC